MTERIDPETGEIIEPAATPHKLQRISDDNGVPVPRSGRDAASIIAMLEDGTFNADVAEDLRDLVAAMEAHAHNNKGVAKGKITITLDLALGNGVFVLVGGHTVKKPVAKRMGTALFAREDGALSRNPSGQYRQIGGTRDVIDERDARDAVIEQPTRDI